MMKLKTEDAPEWVQMIIRGTRKRPKMITLNKAIPDSRVTFSAWAGDGEKQQTFIVRPGKPLEFRASSWGGANIFVSGREKQTNEGYEVHFEPGVAVLETLYPKHIGWYLTVRSDDPIAQLGVNG